MPLPSERHRRIVLGPDSLGIANGDLIDRVIARSPGFVAPVTRVGRPRIFVSHGVKDRVLS